METHIYKSDPSSISNQIWLFSHKCLWLRHESIYLPKLRGKWLGRLDFFSHGRQLVWEKDISFQYQKVGPFQDDLMPYWTSFWQLLSSIWCQTWCTSASSGQNQQDRCEDSDDWASQDLHNLRPPNKSMFLQYASAHSKQRRVFIYSMARAI